MSLRAIVRALGGDLYHNGCRANVPGPGHGPADRSVSLVLSEGRVVVHSFGGADWREVLDDLRRRGLIDRRAFPIGSGSGSGSGSGVRGTLRPDRSRRVDTARALWDAGVHTGAEGLLARHLRRRDLAWRSALLDLREHPAAPVSVYGGSSRTHRAMMARISNPEGSTTAVELTYLDPNARRAARLKLSRKTIGQVSPGSAVRLSPIAAGMVVGEGVVSTLSAMDEFYRPGWALLTAGNLARWRAPEGVTDVLIAADRGRTGERAAWTLRDRLRDAGRIATIVWPWDPCGDWNEVQAARAIERKEEGRCGAPMRRGWTPPPAGETP